MESTIEISTKQIAEGTMHDQLHGEPYKRPAYKNVRYKLPSGRTKHFRVDTNATEQEIIHALQSHPRNLKGYKYIFSKHT